MAPLLLALAPLVQSLMSNGLNLLGNAVLVKGQDVIEDKLGIKLKANPSPAELIEMKALEFKHEEFLIDAAIKQREQELEVVKVDNENTANARDMNKGIQESANASYIAKVAPYWLDCTIILVTCVVIVLMYFKGVPTENKELAYMAVGALLTMCGTILNFHRGTSSGSHKKDETINNLALVGAGNEPKN